MNISSSYCGTASCTSPRTSHHDHLWNDQRSKPSLIPSREVSNSDLLRSSSTQPPPVKLDQPHPTFSPCRLHYRLGKCFQVGAFIFTRILSSQREGYYTPSKTQELRDAEASAPLEHKNSLMHNSLCRCRLENRSYAPELQERGLKNVLLELGIERNDQAV